MKDILAEIHRELKHPWLVRRAKNLDDILGSDTRMYIRDLYYHAKKDYEEELEKWRMADDKPNLCGIALAHEWLRQMNKLESEAKARMDNFYVSAHEAFELSNGGTYPPRIEIEIKDRTRCEQMVAIFRELAGNSMKNGFFANAEEELTVAREIEEGLKVFDEEEVEIVKLFTADGQEINLTEEEGE